MSFITREAIETEYTIEHGRIRNPGTFERERPYVPYFWDVHMNGCADHVSYDDYLGFDLTDADLAMWPELVEDGYEKGETLWLWLRSDGFVELCDTPEETEEEEEEDV